MEELRIREGKLWLVYKMNFKKGNIKQNKTKKTHKTITSKLDRANQEKEKSPR